SDVLSEYGCIENLSDGVWQPKGYGANTLRDCNKIQNKQNYGIKGYNIEDNVSDSENKKELYDKYNLPLTKDVRRYSKFLNDTTFGLELECSHGYIPDHL